MFRLKNKLYTFLSQFDVFLFLLSFNCFVFDTIFANFTRL